MTNIGQRASAGAAKVGLVSISSVYRQVQTTANEGGFQNFRLCSTDLNFW